MPPEEPSTGMGAPQSPRPRWGQAARPMAAGELAPDWGLLWSSGRALGWAPRCFNPCQCLTYPARPGGEVGCTALLLLDGSGYVELARQDRLTEPRQPPAPADARVTPALPRCPGSSGQQPPWPREAPMRSPAAGSPAPAPAWVWSLLSGEKFSVHPWEHFPS